MSMFRYFTNVTTEELIARLDASYPSEVKHEWTLPCGIIFMAPGFGERLCLADDWTYRYREGEGPPEHFGFLQRGELIHLLARLEAKEKRKPGFDLYKKPRSIRRLEFLTGKTAELHEMGCLQWGLVIGDGTKQRVSCVNNPYDTLFTHAESKDDFEVFLDGEDEPIEYCDIDSLIEIMNKRGLIRKICVCSFCKNVTNSGALQRCGRCKSAFYCNEECQKNAWKQGHSFACFKL